MRKNRKNKGKTPTRWSAEDRQNFADRNFLRAQTVPAMRYEGPEADEWDDLWDED